MPGEKGTDNRIANRIFDFINIVALSHAHLRYRLKYGNETLVIANVEKDLDEVLRITQNVTGMPTFKVDFFRKYVLPLYKSKTKPDSITTNGIELKESIIGITTREVAEYYKQKTGKSITTNNVKETYFDDYINNGWMDRTDSVINKKQYIYCPVIDLENDNENESEEDKKNDNEKQSSSPESESYNQKLQGIKSLSIMDSMDNVLQHPRMLLPKNFKEIPENWLELEILAHKMSIRANNIRAV